LCFWSCLGRGASALWSRHIKRNIYPLKGQWLQYIPLYRALRSLHFVHTVNSVSYDAHNKTATIFVRNISRIAFIMRTPCTIREVGQKFCKLFISGPHSSLCGAGNFCNNWPAYGQLNIQYRK
jgi:hypothetical protein